MSTALRFIAEHFNEKFLSNGLNLVKSLLQTICHFTGQTTHEYVIDVWVVSNDSKSANLTIP